MTRDEMNLKYCLDKAPFSGSYTTLEKLIAEAKQKNTSIDIHVNGNRCYASIRGGSVTPSRWNNADYLKKKIEQAGVKEVRVYKDW